MIGSRIGGSFFFRELKMEETEIAQDMLLREIPGRETIYAAFPAGFFYKSDSFLENSLLFKDSFT